jgi:hypothetical protein
MSVPYHSINAVLHTLLQKFQEILKSASHVADKSQLERQVPHYHSTHRHSPPTPTFTALRFRFSGTLCVMKQRHVIIFQMIC